MPAPPRTLLLYDGSRRDLAERAQALTPVIEAQLDVVGVDSDLEPPFKSHDAELVIAMGGDGTMLRSARLMGREQLPLLGVNLGKLGFLAGINPEQLDDVLPEIVERRYRLVDHLMIECSLVSGGETKRTVLGVNEAMVNAGEPFRMIHVQLRIDGVLAATYPCDGVLVSTPVGSTAHNLSIGGPILSKRIQALVVSAVSPHTLTVRPVVDSADRVYELSVVDPNPGTSILVDGQMIGPLGEGDVLRVERSPAVLQLVETPGQTYYQTLREKLGWARGPSEK